MKAYFKSYSIAMQEDLQYRTDFIISFFTGFLYTYAKVAIWCAIVTANREKLDPALASDTIMYMIIVASLSAIYGSIPLSEITRRVTTGEIGRDLFYPISLPVSLFFRGLGGATIALITKVIPSLLILSFMLETSWEFNLSKILGLLVTLLLGYYIYFLINLQIDMLSFWWYETYYFHYFKEAIFAFLSGTLVPLWFYPEWLYKIVAIFPFQNIAYIPVQLYLGNVPGVEVFSLLLNYAIWIAVLTGLTYLMWSAGTKKVVVQGG